MKTDEKENIRDYVIGFIRLKKGPDAVQEETGINRITLYQILNKRNFVSRKTLDRLAAAYDDFDHNMVLGLSPELQANKPEPVDSADTAYLRTENEELRRQLRAAMDELTVVRQELRELSKDFRDIAKMSFNGSSSQFTAMIKQYERVGRAGFRQKFEDAQPIDRFHPNVRVSSPSKVMCRLRITD